MGRDAADQKLLMAGSPLIGCSLLLWHQTSDAEFPCATCVVLVQQEVLARRDYSGVRTCACVGSTIMIVTHSLGLRVC